MAMISHDNYDNDNFARCCCCFPVTCLTLPLEKSRVLWAFQTKSIENEGKTEATNNEHHIIRDTVAKTTLQNNKNIEQGPLF